MRSLRSAITPAYGLSTSEGTKRTSPDAPTQPSECVRPNTNANSATLYAQLPVAETSRPLSSSRRSRLANADLYGSNQREKTPPRVSRAPTLLTAGKRQDALAAQRPAAAGGR